MTLSTQDPSGDHRASLTKSSFDGDCQGEVPDAGLGVTAGDNEDGEDEEEEVDELSCRGIAVRKRDSTTSSGSSEKSS
jgi:hypothetical protein